MATGDGEATGTVHGTVGMYAAAEEESGPTCSSPEVGRRIGMDSEWWLEA